jgi:hypothetical protein
MQVYPFSNGAILGIVSPMLWVQPINSLYLLVLVPFIFYYPSFEKRRSSCSESHLLAPPFLLMSVLRLAANYDVCISEA